MTMGIVDSIRGLLGGEARTYEYVCRDCDAAFESRTAKMSDVHCPECNSTRVRSTSMSA